MSDTTTGIHGDDVNGSAIIDYTESGTVLDDMAMEMLDNGNVKIFAGGRYCGLARIIRGTDAGVSSAVKGERITLLRKGVHQGIDSEDDTLKLNEPVKPTGTAGKLRLWVGGTDYADDLVGYEVLFKNPDAIDARQKKFLAKLVGSVLKQAGEISIAPMLFVSNSLERKAGTTGKFYDWGQLVARLKPDGIPTGLGKIKPSSVTYELDEYETKVAITDRAQTLFRS